MMLFLLGLVLQTGPATPEGQALVEAVKADYAAVRARQAELPPPANDSQRLERLGKLDRAGRRLMMSSDFSLIPEADRPVAIKAASEVIASVDAQNQAALIQLLPPEGWFLSPTYGPKAADAAFHIVQHADIEMWRRFLPLLEPLAQRGQVDGQSYAMMYDRLATSEGRPQVYGTQFRCDGGKWRPYPIQDPDQIEARRATMNFPVPFSAYLAHFQSMPSCPQTLSPPPVGMVIDD